METISIAVAGFSAVSAVLLFCTYAFLIDVQGKSAYSVISCGVLLAALASIQIAHARYFGGGAPPLDLFHYRLMLFVVPPAFYFFGRWAIQPTERFRLAGLRRLWTARAAQAVPVRAVLFLRDVGDRRGGADPRLRHSVRRRRALLLLLQQRHRARVRHHDRGPDLPAWPFPGFTGTRI